MECDCVDTCLLIVFRGLSWMSVEGDMEAGVGIEPAYTALQAAA